MDCLNLREKLDLLTNEDIYNMLIQMNFSQIVAQYFKGKHKYLHGFNLKKQN
jgi:hypothetical protein